MNKKAIGIFDSGIGGLTVVDKIFRLLPNEQIIYFGDTARVPYGNKSKETITRFSKEIVRFLLDFKVKLVIVACNTASSLSLDALKRSFSVPIIGVIKPGVKEALRVTTTGRIGVIGTEATVSSNIYKKEIKSIDRNAFVIQKSSPLFVPLVENRWLNGDITRRVAKKYLSSMIDERIDTLILGCTHYPLLKDVIQKTVSKRITLIDSSMAVARHTRELLQKRGLLNGEKMAKPKFFASDDTKSFASLAKVFLKKRIDVKRVVL